VNDFDDEPRVSVNRRAFLTGVGAAGLGAAAATLLAGCGSGSGTITNPNPLPTATPTPPAGVTDADVLNFALNLEYLEAEYYLRAVSGTGLSGGEAGAGAGAVTGGRQVSFATSAFRQYAEEIAADERAHVNFLRNALGGAAVPRPSIDFTTAFNAAAQAAGIGATFDPFANETNFLVGAFLFEDVGVTAYKGAARLLNNLDFLDAAAGILAVEALHAGEVRTVLYELGATTRTLANQISALRATAGGGKDQGIEVGGQENIAPTDSNALAFGRNTSEVLRIVYLTPGGNPSSGGFFPNGLNGTIKAA
jgi:hypothetical protein